jgi:release factor glutamine methyltransferase
VGALLRERALPAPEGRALLAFVLGCTREHLAAHPGKDLDASTVDRWRALASRRAAGEPLAYLLGNREFHGHAFSVGPGVLVPRPETELLVDTGLALLQGRPGARVLELGTGSGCIAVSIALARPDLRILATDISQAALACAQDNARRLGAAPDFASGPWYDAIGEARDFDLVIANPPYIAAGDPHLPALAHEPLEALSDGGDGLAALREILAGAPARLAPGGALLVEHGHDQAAAVRALALQAGLERAQSLADLAGIERACLAFAPQRI